ncbi:MAG TPA: xanthine dehydrogenase family protein subunit M [Polyangiaceae bacterium]|nr:xanthine dehydrogenase family protein subunit M [Polyangiaceae bacterium]
MKAFDYTKPTSLEEATQRGSAAGARFIAGGTLLVDLMRLNVERPDLLVDLGKLALTRGDLRQIELDATGLRIGALVRNTDLAYHAVVLDKFPVLSEALLSGASPQIRNMASVSGNLLQRTRCAYFRDTAVKQCNKRSPGSGCAALDGFSRMHAILGVSPNCIAAHPSDMCVALAALDAVVVIRGSAGEREVPLSDFHVLPADHPEVESVLGHGEIVTHVRVPSSPFAKHSAYVKARDRASFAFALASAAAALELQGTVIRSARIALGGVGTKPWRCAASEAKLVGGPANRAAFESAAKLGLAGAKTTKDNAFKVKIAERAVVRALEIARSKA